MGSGDIYVSCLLLSWTRGYALLAAQFTLRDLPARRFWVSSYVYEEAGSSLHEYSSAAPSVKAYLDEHQPHLQRDFERHIFLVLSTNIPSAGLMLY